MTAMFTRRDVLKTAMAGTVLPLVGADANRAEGFKLGIITDELSDDLEEALKFITSYGLHGTELRVVWGKNIMSLSPAELETAKKLVARYGLQVTDIASPIFKWNLPAMPAKTDEKRDTFNANFTEEDTGKLLDESFKIARMFGARKVRIFSYWRVNEPDKAFPHVCEKLAAAAKVAAKNDITLVLENEHACNVGTGKELGRLVRQVNSLNLRGVWDPANAAMLGEVPFPDGYREVKGLFPHFHIKDVRKNTKTGDLEWAPVLGGFIDWKGQIQALRKDGYEGTMSLETHYRRPDGNRIESSRESLEGLFKAIKA